MYDFDLGDNNEDPKLEWDDVVTSYVPHGLNHNMYKPISESDELYQKFYNEIKVRNNVDFVVFWNNRNIRRKQDIGHGYMN